MFFFQHDLVSMKDLNKHRKIGQASSGNAFVTEARDLWFKSRSGQFFWKIIFVIRQI